MFWIICICMYICRLFILPYSQVITLVEKVLEFWTILTATSEV